MTRFLRLTGLSPYERVHTLQQQLLVARLAETIDDTVLLVEHAPTITVGRRRGALANVLAAGDTPVVRVERGGDVTWHGPGQLVAYPIVYLKGPRQDLHAHLRRLEDAVIGLLLELGLKGVRDARNTGAWLPSSVHPDKRNEKVCSVGIACRKWVTWHGLALNVDPDLSGFQRINPCGFDSVVITRLADHLEPCPTVHALVEPLSRHLALALQVPWSPVEESTVDGCIDKGA